MSLAHTHYALKYTSQEMQTNIRKFLCVNSMDSIYISTTYELFTCCDINLLILYM